MIGRPLGGDHCPILAYSVEKLCFEKSDDFICVLSAVLYCRHEGVVRII